MDASTWMDPLIKAQQTKKRRGSGYRSPVLRNNGAKSERRARAKRERAPGIGHALTDWDQDPLETLPEMEQAVGIADWIDPQTGTPAEGQSPLHIGFE